MKLTDERAARVKRYRHKEDRARCLVGGLLLRAVFGEKDSARLTYGKNGKPYIGDGAPYFNLSHCGEYVILAVADTEVGADIEAIRPYPENLAKRCLREDELLWLRVQEDCDRAFFSLWTAKECVMKATGLGLALDPLKFGVLPVCDGAREIERRIFHLYWRVLNGYQICVASGGAAETVTMINLTREELLNY